MIRFAFTFLFLMLLGTFAQTSKVDTSNIEPIHFFFLIPNLSDNGEHFKDYLKSIGRCATWRDIFNEQVKFSDEITPEEAQDILDKVEKEFRPLEDEINQKQEKAQSDHNAEEAGDAVLGKVALTRAKVQKAKAYEQEYLMKKAQRPEVREKASQQKKQYEEAAKRSKKEAKESFATDNHFKDEIEKERNRLSGKGDLQGLEYLKSIEELFKDLPQTRNDKALLDAIGDYEFHVSGVKITGQQLLEAVLTGSRAVRGGPGAVTLTMAMKLLHSIVRDNYQDWMRGGGDSRPLADALRQAEVDRIMKIIKPDGITTIGKAGSSSSIREIYGTLKDAEFFFGSISPDCRIIKHLDNGGKVVELPNGAGHVTFRPKSSSGYPAVDIQFWNSGRRISFKFLN